MKKEDEEIPAEDEGEGQTTVTIKAKSPKQALSKMRKMTPQDEDDTIKDFAQVIKNPQNTILAERQTPTELNDRLLQNEVEIQTPTNIIKIRKKLENEFGGKSWFVGAYDENGEKIGGMTIDIAKPPKPKYEEPEDEYSQIPGGRGSGFSFPVGDEGEDDDLIDQQIEMEKKKGKLKMYKEFAGGEGSDGKWEKMVAEMKASNDKVITEMKTGFENRITQIQADNKETIKSMEQRFEAEKKKSEFELLRQELTNQQKNFNDTISSLKTEMSKSKGDSAMELMFKTLTESQTKMSENMNKMLEGKIASLVDSNKSNLETLTKMSEMSSAHNKQLLEIATDRGDKSLGKTIETFKALKEVINPSEEPVPMDFGSRVVNAIETLAPRFIEAYEKRRETPEALDKSEFTKSLVSELKPFIKEVVARETKKLPAKPPETGGPPKGEIKENPEEKVEEGELSMSPEEIKKDTNLRVDSILKIMSKEMDIRPAEAQFVDVALKNLPAEFLDKIVACKDQAELFKLLGEYASPVLLAGIGVKLAMSPEKQKWLKEQIEILIEDYKEIKGA